MHAELLRTSAREVLVAARPHLLQPDHMRRGASVKRLSATTGSGGRSARIRSLEGVVPAAGGGGSGQCADPGRIP
ncbi:hypothetical protein [Streptomyces sp. ME19-01-6]|uniref:hypothetical protein n=1 Tax=Streptomyces sp. ME19-01-6 TaxID=3028686 RepID=UPI0039F515B0